MQMPNEIVPTKTSILLRPPMNLFHRRRKYPPRFEEISFSRAGRSGKKIDRWDQRGPSVLLSKREPNLTEVGKKCNYAKNRYAKEIDRWHRSRGWLKIGYHKVLKRDGTEEDGRHLMDVGAHAKGYNHKSVGVAMIGGVTEEDHTKAENNFTPEQWEALDLLLTKLTARFPKATIIGHNEISSKECPSFNVQDWLADKPYSNLKRILK